jgi:hypothetical protein
MMSRVSTTSFLTRNNFRLPVTRPETLSILAVDLALLSPDGGIRWNIKMSVA